MGIKTFYLFIIGKGFAKNFFCKDFLQNISYL